MKSTKRRSLDLLFALLLAGLPATAFAQGADQFFHNGARHFLATNELAQAKLSVTNGLKLHPGDPKLLKLWELLNQQQNQSKQQDKQEQQKQDQEKQDQQKQEEQKKQQDEQKKQEEQQGAKPDKNDDEEKKQGEQTSPEQPPEGGEEPKDGAPMKVMKMTPQQAMQLLDTLKAEEKNLTFRPVLKTNRQNRVFKDW